MGTAKSAEEEGSLAGRGLSAPHHLLPTLSWLGGEAARRGQESLEKVASDSRHLGSLLLPAMAVHLHMAAHAAHWEQATPSFRNSPTKASAEAAGGSPGLQDVASPGAAGGARRWEMWPLRMATQPRGWFPPPQGVISVIATRTEAAASVPDDPTAHPKGKAGQSRHRFLALHKFVVNCQSFTQSHITEVHLARSHKQCWEAGAPAPLVEVPPGGHGWPCTHGCPVPSRHLLPAPRMPRDLPNSPTAPSSIVAVPDPSLAPQALGQACEFPPPLGTSTAAPRWETVAVALWCWRANPRSRAASVLILPRQDASKFVFFK